MRYKNGERKMRYTIGGLLQVVAYVVTIPTLAMVLFILDRTDVLLRSVILFHILMSISTYIQTRGLKPRNLINLWVGIILTIIIPMVVAHLTIMIVGGRLINPIAYLSEYIGLLWGDIFRTAILMIASKLQLEVTMCGILYIVRNMKGTDVGQDKNLPKKDESIFVSDDDDYTYLNGKPKINTKFYEIED